MQRRGLAAPRICAGAVVVVLLNLALALPATAQPTPPPPAVVVAEVVAEPVSRPAEFVGRMEAIRSLDLRARVQGFVTEVPFEEGSAVRRGDPLFLLDPSQHEAELASAEAQLSRAQATAEEAQRSLGRSTELRRTNTVPQARVDEAQAIYDGARADVLAAEAAVRLARLTLSYTRIEAPIDGRIGRANFSTGALVGPDSGALARVVQLQPLRVVFSVTEGMIVDFREAQRREGAAVPDMTLRLRLPNGSLYDRPGRFDFLDSEVASNTGTVAVRAIFDNPDEILLPGQFVTVIVAARAPEMRPLVPFSAVQRDREGAFVFVLGENDTVARRRIETGARLARGWSVTSGLAAGETVVVQGTQRLRDGLAVRPARQGEGA
ncbi:efflux RND transporter periplasmic adaptor subunit [Falsiroseomonas sp.]|uniref:efflux RND transporter periplasmic adaptor subunit n=1 Tax=Falsiroseomonas sp. TaxID=2870721 RepID=UPI00271DB366|nr:efflux RND transporter periplasmic adaptor subunit [Falsiroseomonas sp.]MDO9501496.1 efflux RND transporter periplasmic adaptor subunit [Falsiroseomonas sp.]MDP3417084.1 efflux RND transporter periplasmic adaptor subunit [Falsiroseomonas sp.]